MNYAKVLALALIACFCNLLPMQVNKKEFDEKVLVAKMGRISLTRKLRWKTKSPEIGNLSYFIQVFSKLGAQSDTVIVDQWSGNQHKEVFNRTIPSSYQEMKANFIVEKSPLGYQRIVSIGIMVDGSKVIDVYV